MSRLSDYSKFDHLDENSNSDDDDDEQPAPANEEQDVLFKTTTPSSSVDQRQQETPQPSNAAQIPRVDDDARPAVNDDSSTPSSGGIHKRLDDDSNQHRFVYMIHNQALYQWEQKVESVNIFVPAPPNAKASDILCNIQPTHLQLGMRHAIMNQQAYYFNFDLHGKIETNESTWYIEDNNFICIVLTKAHPGQVWTRVFTTEPPLNSLLQQHVQQELMKERFQMEHAGFDFRNAEFSGMAPNPREFMGGMPSI